MKTRAILTVKRAGALTADEAKKLATWLRGLAKTVQHDSAKLTTGRFRARYFES